MNYWAVAKILGLLLLLVGVFMLPSMGWSLYYADGSWIPLLWASLITIITGTATFLMGRRKRQDLFRRETTLVVAAGWLLTAVFGALPYYLANAFPSFADCFFESMSGFTTTGSSVLVDFEKLPKGLHFWRGFTHWFGGMGIILLFVILLPFLGASGRALIRRESSAPVRDMMTPRIKQTAFILWQTYLLLTIIQTIALMLCGMDLFDALIHTFATLGTGGFSNNGASIAGYNSLSIDLTIIIFMIIGGTNFLLISRAFRGDTLSLARSTEWRVYLGLIVACTIFATLIIFWDGIYASFWQALRYASFQVISLLTTTGFATADYNLWPLPVRCMLALLLFLGACSGSTAGGVKIVRWIILAKIARMHVECVCNPRAVRQIKLGNAIIAGDTQLAVLGFFFLWVALFAIGTLLLCCIERSNIDIVSAATAVSTVMSNVGPGLNKVGPVANFAFLHESSKYLLSLFMLLGRLELYTVMVLLVPVFWRGR